MAINTFRGAVKQDPDYRKLKRLLKNGAFKLDVAARIDEIKRLHATRVVRTLKYTEIVKEKQKQLITASLDNTATRSRATEIKMECTEISSTLEEHLSALVKHLKATYASQLRASGYKALQAQDDAVKHMLRDAYAVLRSMERITKICDLLIVDVDQAAHSLTLVKNVLELSTRKERNL